MAARRTCQHRAIPAVRESTEYRLRIDGREPDSAQLPARDVILVDSSLTLVPGEDVLVCEKNGEITIQRLARFDDQHYYLDSANSQRVIHDKSDLQFVHQVVGTIKSFMVEGR
ncbi:S24 family peptidase [Enterobacter hormaechei]|uniref:S24 family peptidase n=1 Tax=Enterobacter hormaechei TaxID=158836 RepID=UPI00388D33E7